jgi:DNA-binding transcriptional regulator YhcF (GntR family)
MRKSKHLSSAVESDEFRYQQIANDLRQMLRDGVYRPGDKLPTERDLSRQFNVAHLTIRRAHQDLEAEGVIRRERGRGTFVCNVPAAPVSKTVRRVGFFSVDSPLDREHLRVVREGLEAAGCRLSLDFVDQPALVTRLPEIIERERLDLVLLDGHIDASWLRSVATLPTPVLVCGTLPTTPGVSMVTPDMEKWAYDLTRLLLDALRYDHVWLVVEPLRLYYNRLVVSGYRRALRDTKGPAEMLVLCDDDRWDPFTRQFNLLQPRMAGRHAVIWMYNYPFVPMTELPAKAMDRLGVVNYGRRDPGWFVPTQCDLGLLPAPDPQYAQLTIQLALDLLQNPQLRGEIRRLAPILSVVKGNAGPTVQLRWQI